MTFAEARLAEIHAQRAELIEKRTQLRAEQAEQKKMLLEAVETMKKTKKWEAPPGVSMDIDVEGLISKVQNERSAGTLPAIRPPASTADVAASSLTEHKPKGRAKEPSDISRAANALPHPPAVEKPISKPQQVICCCNLLQMVNNFFSRKLMHIFQSPRLVLSASQQKAVSKPKRPLSEAKVRHKIKGSGSSGALSQSELALIAVDELRRSQNEALLRVLEEEQVLENCFFCFKM